MYKKDGTFNDRYDCLHNQIPFCFEDFQQIFHIATEEEGEVNIGRNGCQAFCEIARFFMLEIIARPISLKQQYDVPPIYLLENVRLKYPELYKDASKLYAQYLQKWTHSEHSDSKPEIAQQENKKEKSSSESSSEKQPKPRQQKNKINQQPSIGVQTRGKTKKYIDID